MTRAPVKLLIEPAEGPAFKCIFDMESMIIGRASTSDLLISDPFLSRHHARLFQQNGQLFIEDLDSRNGTEVNGSLIHGPLILVEGDSIRVSGSRIDLGQHAARISTVDLQATVLRPATEFLRSVDLDTQDGDIDTDSLRDYAQRLHRLNEVHQLIGETLSPKELTETLLSTVSDLLQAHHVALFLQRADGTYHQAARQSSPGAVDRAPLYSRSLIDEVCTRGMAALIRDAANDERFAQSQSLILSGPQSMAAAPLLSDQGSLGMVVASTAATVREFGEEHLELLTSIASVAALKMRNLRLAQVAIARQRMEQELVIARRIQESLLPQTLPQFKYLELFARNTPSRGVSGDFFQITSQLDGQRCLVLIVDVSGKGVPAALLTASIEALAVGPIEDHRATEEIFETVSRRLYERSPPEKYATAFLAVIGTETGECEYTNAGHNPPLVVRQSGECDKLEIPGQPLGLIKGSQYTTGHTVLHPGDALVAYTDGLTEASDPGGNEYGPSRLSASATRHRQLPISAYGEALLADIELFAKGQAPGDDCTLVIARTRTQDASQENPAQT